LKINANSLILPVIGNQSDRQQGEEYERRLYYRSHALSGLIVESLLQAIAMATIGFCIVLFRLIVVIINISLLYNDDDDGAVDPGSHRVAGVIKFYTIPLGCWLVGFSGPFWKAGWIPVRQFFVL
jgi:hypothetical protein